MNRTPSCKIFQTTRTADGRWPKWQTHSPVEAADAGTPLGNSCLSSWPQRGPPGSAPAAGICFLLLNDCCGSLRRFPPSSFPGQVPTQEVNCAAEGNVLACTPTSASRRNVKVL